MTLEITNQVRIQEYPNYWYTAENTNIDIGYGGCTVSYWEFQKDVGDKRVTHICMNEDEALAIADAIYKFFKN